MTVLARRHAEKFSWSGTARATHEAYDEALAMRPVLLRRYA
jgi:hypothetical protein